MKTIPQMPKTDISIEDGQVIITQTDHYRQQTIIFPLVMLNLITNAINSERPKTAFSNPFTVEEAL